MSPASTVMMVARIAGAVDEQRLQQALSAVCSMHPLLMAKVIFDQRHEAYFSAEGVSPAGIQVVPRVSESQWLDLLADEARIPFDLERGPLIRCLLLQSENISELLVLCNHSICDGMALAGLIRDLLSRYADMDQESRSLPPPDLMDFLHPRTTLRGLVARGLTALANRKWRRRPYHFGSDDYAALYRAYWRDRRAGVVLFEFDTEASGRLLASCREHSVTVGSAVSTACLLAHADVTGGFAKPQRKIFVPFDLRRRAVPPTGDVFCFCNGGITFPIKYSSKRTFWENAREMNGTIQTLVDRHAMIRPDIPSIEPSLIDALSAFAPFAKRVPAAFDATATLQRFIGDTQNVSFSWIRSLEKKTPGLASSNLGRIEMPASTDGLRVERLVFLPSASEGGPLVLGGVSAGDRIVFALPFVSSSQQGLSPEEVLIRIRNRALEYLGFPEHMHDRAMESSGNA